MAASSTPSLSSPSPSSSSSTPSSRTHRTDSSSSFPNSERTRLSLSPSMASVALLGLGNGAPDFLLYSLPYAPVIHGLDSGRFSPLARSSRRLACCRVRFNTSFQDDDKVKVIIVMGSTGTGKSKLSIELATRFNGEIVNSDKIQVHKGLDIITNRVTSEECRGIKHHLLGVVDPDVDFTAVDFCRHVTLTVESISEKGKLPIIAGGSNSYLEELVNKDSHFQKKYDPLFLWVDVKLPVLGRFVSDRVDKMVETGAVEEVRGIFEPESADYSKGIRKAIGVPEFDRFLRAELSGEADVEELNRLLDEAIDLVKRNTYELACKQREKIKALRDSGWELNRVEATSVFEKRGKPEEVEEWEKAVVRPSVELVDRFLASPVY